MPGSSRDRVPADAATGAEPGPQVARRELDRLAVAYQPKPIDTSGVELPEDLLALREVLARNVHDRWAQRRIREGREHPNLVPYEELPESEKEVDRQTALETLKAILALGYRIEK